MARRSAVMMFCLWPLSGLLFAGPVLALGLGDIQVSSRLDQPFVGVIPLRVDSPSDLDGLSITLGSAAAFRRAGIEPTDALSSLSFKVDSSGAKPVIRVLSQQPIREPFLNFLVEAHWNGGTLMREYTVLMDPPGTSAAAVGAPSAATVSSTPTSTSTAAAAPVEPAPAPPRPATHPAPASRTSNSAARAMPAPAGSHRYGPVKPGETFWSIATRARPSAGVTMDQVLLSIYDANPKAFDQGRFNGLMKGQVLRIPSARQMQSVSAADAKARVAALRRGTAASASASVAASTPASPTAVATQPTPPPQAGSAIVPVPAQLSSVPPAAAITHAAGAPVEAVKTPPAAAGTVPTPASNDLAVSQPAPAEITNAAGVPAAAASAAGTQAGKTPTPVNPPATGAPVAPPASSSRPAQAPAVKRIAAPPLRRPAPTTSAGWMALFERWRTPLLGVLAIAALLALLLLRRRRPADVEPADEGTPPTARGIGRVAAVAGAGAATAAAVSDEALEPHRAAAEPEHPDDAAATMPTPEPTAPAYAGDSDQSDFDRANATGARTLDVAGDMSTEDALGEADFHLAYGLYDEAISLVQSALVKAPQRRDLQLKLAECYAAAGRPVEFQELAETLHGRVDPTAWEKLAEQGRKLCPGVALFGGADVAAASTDGVDEQAATPGDSVIDFEPGPEPEPRAAQLASEAIPAAPAKSKSPASPPPTPPPTPPTLNLGDFDSFGERTPQSGADNRLDFKLDDIDLSEPEALPPRPVATPPPGAPAVDEGEFATKLDLARAYSDMGDNDAARSLLDEVAQGGSAAQKAEAEALARQLGA